MRSSNYSKMYNNATIIAGPAPPAPRCKAPGVILLVIGILEFLVFIFLAAGLANATSSVAGWWVFLLSSGGLISTGGLAVAASNGKPHSVSVGAIVMASLTLAWTVIKLIILLVGVVALIVASSAMSTIEPAPEPDVTKAALGIVWGVVAVIAAFTITTFVCLICIIVAVSKVTCCHTPQDQQGIVIQEQPQAVTVVNYPPPYSNKYSQPC
ncbi:uncharacterized protein LOC135496308 [Lineus longissimus]|uniref:uncharacterized protein LOC135496308 n=1 Tax=Lineus longissimus TaxID=88925 RepID=UPI002B4E6AD2